MRGGAESVGRRYEVQPLATGRWCAEPGADMRFGDRAARERLS